MMVMVDMGRKPIVAKAVIKCVKFNSMTQSQEIELMSGDNSVIYDMPLPVMTRTDGGSPKPSSATTAKTNPSTGVDDYPKEVQKQESKSEVTTSANDSNYTASSSGQAAKTGGDSRPVSRGSSKSDSNGLMADLLGAAQRSQQRDVERAETKRKKIYSGDEMKNQSVDENKYSPEAADKRRADAAKSKADGVEAAILKKALNKSVSRPGDADETE